MPYFPTRDGTPWDRQEFFPQHQRGGTGVGLGVHVWTRPRGCRFISIVAQGGGGAGGAGFQKASGTTGRGGGGGGSGALVSAIFMADFLPSQLLIIPALGGLGGAGTGVDGGFTYVYVAQSGAAGNDISGTILMARPGFGGVVGATASGGTGGAAGAVTNNDFTGASPSSLWYRHALALNARAGQAGAAGGLTDAAGSTITPANPYNSGGTGGGGTTTVNTAGGAIVTSGLQSSLVGGVATGQGQDGRNMLADSQLGGPYGCGGTGGGSNAAATAGAGGSGGFGSGGGGGGSGTVAGQGGNGGCGWVVIECW